MSENEAKPADPVPFYPLIAAVFPILVLFSANIAILPLSDIMRPLLVALGATLAVQGLATFLLRDRRRGAAATLFLVLSIWTFESAKPLYAQIWSPVHVLPTYLGLTALVIGIAAAIKPPTRPFNVLAAMVGTVATCYLLWVAARPPVPAATSKALTVARPLPAGPRPDVVHVVLDGFGREDRLREAIGVDLGWFTSALRERGFQVSDQARPNYVQTELSISSTLNMDYLPTLIPNLGRESTDRRILDPLIQTSVVARRFQASGYRYVALGSGFEGLHLGVYEMPIRSSRVLSMAESTLLEKTPWSLQSTTSESQFDSHRERLLELFDQIGALGARTGTPRYSFVHILAPHPPFVFGANGEPKRARGPFGYWDASDYLTTVGPASQYREGFSGQVQFVAKRILGAVDQIIRSNPDAVIILQGDHGSKVGLDQASLERTDIHEAFGILYAVRAPASLGIQVPSASSPVNTYRRLFQALGATDLPLLPDRSYYSPYPRPFDFTDVTDRLTGSASK